MDVEYLLMLKEDEQSKDGDPVDSVEVLVVQEEVEQMSTSSILAEMTHPAMMTGQLEVIATGIVVNEGSAAVTETRNANEGALVLEKDAGIPGLVSVKGSLLFQERKVGSPADVETEKGREVLLGTVERGVGTGIESETAREEAEAGTERERGREGRVQMEVKALAG